MSASFRVVDNEAKLYPGHEESVLEGGSRSGGTGNRAQGSRSPDAGAASAAGDVKRGNRGNPSVGENINSTACLLPESDCDCEPHRADRSQALVVDDRVVANSPTMQPHQKKKADIIMSSECATATTTSMTTSTSAGTARLLVDMPPSSSLPSPSLSSSSPSTSSSSTAAVPDDITASKVPARALNVSTRTRLSLMLNPRKAPFCSDWMGLAGEMGFEYEEIENFERERDPTKAVLSAWTCRPGSTIGGLLTMLQEINRVDVLDEIKKLAERDARRWMERRKGDIHGQPVQVPEVSGSYPYVPETPELRGITLEDHVSGPPEVFDAYVCFTYADSEFVKEMMSVLEKEPYNLKLCIDFRDLVPGGSYSTITAELIENRCKRMIVILSPDFLVSEDCNFQTKFAHSISPSARSKRLIPVMVQNCSPPSILRHLTICDYTKMDLRQWFWPRLYGALTKK